MGVIWLGVDMDSSPGSPMVVGYSELSVVWYGIV
jgi:hypothetical protein